MKKLKSNSLNFSGF